MPFYRLGGGGSKLELNCNWGFNLKSLLTLKKCAFTLAEVLITLGIVGIVAAITLPFLITKIQNKGYVERLKKAQSVLQSVAMQMIDEGLPFSCDGYGIARDEGGEAARVAMRKVIDGYASKLNTVQVCDQPSHRETECNLPMWSSYKYLNNSVTSVKFDIPYYFAYSIILSDGMVISIRFKSAGGGGYFWGEPEVRFGVDVNGKKGPNKLGRDIFYLYMNDTAKGYVLPYGDGKFGSDDCNKDGLGMGCAFKIFKEGKMNY